MRRVLVALALLYLVVYLVLPGVRPLHSPDETRYAEIPREMLVSGDWVVPHLDGVRYFEKPPLGYWITALSIRALGENRLAVRLPPAAAVGLTALILLALARRFTGSSRVGPVAVGVYLTSLLVFIAGTINTLDSLLALLLTGTIAAVVCAAEEPPGARRNRFLVLAGLCCGLAFLAKGFLGPVVPAIVLGPWLLLERRWRDIARLAWLPALVALAVSLPWAVMVHLREPGFWHYFFWVEHVDRFLRPVGSSQHPASYWYFLPVLVVSQLLWLAQTPSVIAGWRARGAWLPLLRLTSPWFVIPFLFFSASRGKLATYILPSLPPLALLTAAGLVGFLEGRRRGARFSIGAWTTVVAMLAALGLALAKGRAFYGASGTWRWGLLLAALVGWCLLAGAAALLARPWTRLWVYGCAPLLFMCCAPWLVPDSATRGRALDSLIAENAVGITPETLVVADRSTVHAGCWFLKRNDLYLLESPGELAHGLSYPDAHGRLLQPAELAERFRTDWRGRDVVLLVKQERFAALVEAGVATEPPRAPEVDSHADLVWARFAGGAQGAALADSSSGGGPVQTDDDRPQDIEDVEGLRRLK